MLVKWDSGTVMQENVNPIICAGID